MGNSSQSVSPGIKQYVASQYNRIRHPSRSYLTISELLQVQPHQDYPFDFRHLSILYVADSTLDGVFSLDDLSTFTEWIHINLGWAQAYQFQSQLQARTLSQMIDACPEAQILTWFMSMLLRDQPHKLINQHKYIKIQLLKILFEVFNVKMEMDIQSFFFLLKRSSEDIGFRVQEVEEEDIEEYIHIGVCEEFVRQFLCGSMKILKEVGYSHQSG